MIIVDEIEVYGFKSAIRGMRNPLNSWNRSDSTDTEVGANDLDLMNRLYKAGTEHRKFMRQIIVSMDITAPLYWWKEFDTYKVGTVANSCSTMHKLTSRPLTIEDFSFEDLDNNMISVVFACNELMKEYKKTKDKKYWRKLIQLLPSGYNQKRTVTMNYEVAVTMIRQRENHKLTEWVEFVEVLKELPYMAEITKGGNNG